MGIVSSWRDKSAPSTEPSINTMHAVYSWFGGAAIDTLKKCQKSVQERRSARGALLLFTVASSALLAGLAWGLVSKSVQTGVIVGVVWFLLIGALDRVLMGSMDGPSDGNKLKLAGLMFARLGVIVVMAHLNSHFVQLWMFNKEIEDVIKVERRTRLETARTELDEKEKAFNVWYKDERKRIDEALALSRKARQDLIDEVSGKGGSRRPGYAQIAKAKEEAIAKEEANLKKEADTFEASTKGGVEARRLKNAQEAFNEFKAEHDGKTSPGFKDRSKALEKVADDSTIVWWMYGLFMLIELLAFLAKIFSPEDEYDLRIGRLQADAGAKFGLEDLLQDKIGRDAIVQDTREQEIALRATSELAQKMADSRVALLKARETELEAIPKHVSLVQNAIVAAKEAGLNEIAGDVESRSTAVVIDISRRFGT